MFLSGLFIFRKYFESFSTKYVGYAGLGLIFYVVVSFIMSPNIAWFLPPLICLLSFIIGAWTAYRKPRVLLLVLISWHAFALTYAFQIYPDLQFRRGFSTHAELASTESYYQWMDQFGEERFDDFRNKVVLIETWNQFCGNCFQAMRDLGPLIRDLSLSPNEFSHIHLYSYPDLDSSTIQSIVFENKHFPDGEMQILIDVDQRFTNSFCQGCGQPQFYLMNKSGEVIQLFLGYNKTIKITTGG